MKNILFIANAQLGEPPTGGGVQTKNRFLIDYLESQPDIKIKVVDTWGRNKLISLVLSVINILISSKKTEVVFSITRRGVISIVFIITLLRIRRKMLFIVPGSDLRTNMSRLELSLLARFDKVLVQGECLRKIGIKEGLENCEVLYNFKKINYRPARKKRGGNFLRFCYLGRLRKDKGVDLIIDAITAIGDSRIVVDFYGREEEYTKNYFEKFSNLGVNYKGFLDLSNNEGYDILSQYDAMLFPTYFEGEGFPGVILDAFISGVPVIASNFHMNSEIITDNYNGLIVQTKEVEALIKAINKLRDCEFLDDLSYGAFISASMYSSDIVLRNVF